VKAKPSSWSQCLRLRLLRGVALANSVSVPRSVTCKGEAVILVPVLEAEIVEGRGVGELQVGKVPVDDLPVT